MGQVRWAGWTMAIATALAISGAQTVRADIASDKPASIVIYPKVAVDSVNGVDTVIRLTNVNEAAPIQVHCFYLDANSHCQGGDQDGMICTGNPRLCTQGGTCQAGWSETDFRIVMTPKQPIDWRASQGLADAGSASGPGDDNLPIASGVCVRNQFKRCGTDADCSPFPGGACTPSNAGTRIPPVPEDSFVGELKCIAIDANGDPVKQNDLKGEALVETVNLDPGTGPQDFDVASYNAIGVQGIADHPGNELTLGGDNPEYNGCPNFLILDHFFDDAIDPVPGTNDTIATNLVLVPCSEDLLRQIPGQATVQYLVYNEFEQRFSTSNTVKCFEDIQLCQIGGGQCKRSIFNVAVAGTLTGQTRLQPIGSGALPSGLLGIAVEYHTTPPTGTTTFVRSAAFNLQMSGARDNPDTITIP